MSSRVSRFVPVSNPRGMGLFPLYPHFVLVAALLSTLLAMYARHGRTARGEERQEVETGLGIFFWLLVIALAGVILWAYV